MIKLGITGGIGMGKSAASAWLDQQGIPIIDTDAVAREVVRPGSPALAEISTAFGKGFLTVNGELDRQALANKVFTDPASRKLLESILHPKIRHHWTAWLAKKKAEGCPVAAVVIPLLYETGAESEFEKVLCLACSPSVQKARLLARGLEESQIAARNTAQIPVARKMDLSHYVVWNDGQLVVLEEQLQMILKSLKVSSPA